MAVTWPSCPYGTSCFAGSGIVTKAELAARVAARVGLTNRQAEAIVGAFIACVAQALRDGDKVELRGFGSFRSRVLNPRQGLNPKTGEAVQVPSRRLPFFRAGKALREALSSYSTRRAS